MVLLGREGQDWLCRKQAQQIRATLRKTEVKEVQINEEKEFWSGADLGLKAGFTRPLTAQVLVSCLSLEMAGGTGSPQSV